MRTVTASEWACAIALIGVCWGCKSPGARVTTYPVQVIAQSDADEALAGVQVVADGRALGTTDAQGSLQASITGQEGQRIELQASCPEHFSGPLEQPSLLLKTFESVDPNASRSTALHVTCAADERLSLVAIRTGRAGVPVLLRGAEVARTTESGTAHVVVRQPAGSSFQLTLDTKQLPDLKPQSPTRLFPVEARDDFTVWDQGFAEQPKKVVHARRAPKPAAPPPPPPKPVPYRLK